jgi:hypothetical protein
MDKRNKNINSPKEKRRWTIAKKTPNNIKETYLGFSQMSMK